MAENKKIAESKNAFETGTCLIYPGGRWSSFRQRSFIQIQTVFFGMSYRNICLGEIRPRARKQVINHTLPHTLTHTQVKLTQMPSHPHTTRFDFYKSRKLVVSNTRLSLKIFSPFYLLNNKRHSQFLDYASPTIIQPILVLKLF